MVRYERRGRYRLDTLIVRHGADAPERVIVPEPDCYLARSTPPWG